MTAWVAGPPDEPAAASRPAGPPRPPPGPDPERLARVVAQAFLEVEAGRRPIAQLLPLLAPALRRRLTATVRRPGPGPAADAVVAVRAVFPHPDACDAAVVVRRGQRVGVLAIRVERHRAVWRVVELARPEDGTRPLHVGSLPGGARPDRGPAVAAPASSHG